MDEELSDDREPQDKVSPASVDPAEMRRRREAMLQKVEAGANQVDEGNHVAGDDEAGARRIQEEIEAEEREENRRKKLAAKVEATLSGVKPQAPSGDASTAEDEEVARRLAVEDFLQSERERHAKHEQVMETIYDQDIAERTALHQAEADADRETPAIDLYQEYLEIDAKGLPDFKPSMAGKLASGGRAKDLNQCLHLIKVIRAHHQEICLGGSMTDWKVLQWLAAQDPSKSSTSSSSGRGGKKKKPDDDGFCNIA